MFTQEHVIATLKEHFEARNDVATVYLFGSYATGNVRRRSDIDVAVLFFDDNNKDERFDRRLKLMADLESVFNMKVDVIDLLDASPLLFHQIMLSRVLVIDNDRDKRIELEVAKRREYFDLKYYLDKYYRNATISQVCDLEKALRKNIYE